MGLGRPTPARSNAGPPGHSEHVECRQHYCGGPSGAALPREGRVNSRGQLAAEPSIRPHDGYPNGYAQGIDYVCRLVLQSHMRLQPVPPQPEAGVALKHVQLTAVQIAYASVSSTARPVGIIGGVTGTKPKDMHGAGRCC